MVTMMHTFDDLVGALDGVGVEVLLPGFRLRHLS